MTHWSVPRFVPILVGVAVAVATAAFLVVSGRPAHRDRASATSATSAASASTVTAHGQGDTGAAGSWEPSTTESAALERAEQTLTAGCMRRKGFRYDGVLATAAADAVSARFPLVVDDVRWAKANGYGAADPALAARRESSGLRTGALASMTPARRQAFSAALYGPPSGRKVFVDLPDGVRISHGVDGCQAAVEARLYGDFGHWFAVTTIEGNLPGMAKEQATATPAYGSAQRAWSGCMRAAGLAVTTPLELRQRLASLADTDPDPAASGAVVTETARRDAVAEATCARDTGFGRVSRQLYEHYLTLVRTRQKEVLEQGRVMRHQALKRLPRILASAGG